MNNAQQRRVHVSTKSLKYLNTPKFVYKDYIYAYNLAFYHVKYFL